MAVTARSLRARIRRIRAGLSGPGVGSWRLPALVAAGVAVVVAIAAVVFVVSGNGGNGDSVAGGGGGTSSAPATPERPTVTSPTTSSPTKPSPTPTKPERPRVGTWQRLPAAPVPSNFYGLAVWTGKEFLLHSRYVAEGAAPRSVGAAYNPTTNTWRNLPVTPDPPEVKEARQVAVWTGKEMLTWGMVDAAYNPRTNTWRRLPPGYGSPAVALWTERQALMWGGGCCGEENQGGIAYDPATGTRQRIPDAPFGGNADGVWTGREMIVVGGQHDRAPLALAAAYNPTTRSWRSLPPLPRPRVAATLTWTGREVLVVGGIDPCTGTPSTLTAWPTTRRPTAGGACPRWRSPGPGTSRCGPDGSCWCGAGRPQGLQHPGATPLLRTGSPTTRPATAGRRCPSPR